MTGLTHNMIETLETVRFCFDELILHPAFGGDAVEFNEGGIGHAAWLAIKTVFAEIDKIAVCDATFSDTVKSAQSIARGKLPYLSGNY